MAASIKTHKEVRGLGNDYTHDWPVTSVPRKPSFYQPVPPDHPKGWSHFVDMKKSRGVPGDVVRHLIEDGEVYFAEGRNRYRFLWTCPGTRVTFSLISELRAEAFAFEHEKHYAITVYPMDHE